MKWEGFAVAYGPPQTMGSKKGFYNPKTKRVAIVDDDSKQLRLFQTVMRESMRETAPEQPITGPVGIEVEIVMQRPKSHYGTGKNAGRLKADAPHYCFTKPDRDKVERAVQDCATGIWVRDDSQFCLGSFVKRYAAPCEEPCTKVRARVLE